MGELRGNFWEVNVTKWKKITTFYGGKWGELDLTYIDGAESHQVGKDSLLGLLKGLQDQTHKVTLRHPG
jgi:hypothetical protein